MSRLIDADTLVKIIDKHTNDENKLDDDITCILEEVPTTCANLRIQFEMMDSSALQMAHALIKFYMHRNLNREIGVIDLEEFAEHIMAFVKAEKKQIELQKAGGMNE